MNEPAVRASIDDILRPSKPAPKRPTTRRKDIRKALRAAGILKGFLGAGGNARGRSEAR